MDSLAAVAKEEGSKLHRDLPGRERRDTIEQQISKIESEIDAEIGRKKKLESDLLSALASVGCEVGSQPVQGTEGY